MYTLGELIGMPPEPPRGTILEARGSFMVERHPDGKWTVVGGNGYRTTWADVFRSFQPLIVVHLP
jgi:hypothetical protein